MLTLVVVTLGAFTKNEEFSEALPLYMSMTVMLDLFILMMLTDILT